MKKIFFALLFSVCCLFGEQVDFTSLEGEVITTEQHSYSIEKYLNKGAFGAVYKATDENGTSVAIKIFLKREFVADPYFTKSWPFPEDLNKKAQSMNVYGFDREWEVGNLFNHPNIIKAYDHGVLPKVNEEDDLNKFLVLEYVSGTTLADVPDGKYSREEAIEIMIQLMEALRYGYANNMFYVDTHAWNMMITDDNVLKIVDLGSFMSSDSFSIISETHASWYLKYVYLLVKRILKKGGHSKEEIAVLTTGFKEAVQNALNDKVTSMEVYTRTMDEWSALMYSN